MHLYRIFLMKGPATIIYTGLRRPIGNPTEYNKTFQENSKNSVDIRIPINETDQHFNQNNNDNSIRASNINISENFDRMGIQSPLIQRQGTNSNA